MIPADGVNIGVPKYKGLDIGPISSESGRGRPTVEMACRCSVPVGLQ